MRCGGRQVVHGPGFHQYLLSAGGKIETRNGNIFRPSRPHRIYGLFASTNRAEMFLSTFLEEDLRVPSELAEGAKGVSLGNLAIPEGRLASLVFLGRERPLECATRPCWIPSSLNSWYVLTRRWRRRCAPPVARGAVARCT